MSASTVFRQLMPIHFRASEGLACSVHVERKEDEMGDFTVQQRAYVIEEVAEKPMPPHR